MPFSPAFTMVLIIQLMIIKVNETISELSAKLSISYD